MTHLFKKLITCLFAFAMVNGQEANAQWTFPYPTEGAPCGSCVPAGWTMVSGSPDISDLDNWIGYSHYGPLGAIAPVPEPTTGVTSFMSAVAWGAYTEEVTTSFTLDSPQTLTIYFAGFGTNSAGGGPAGAEPGVTEAVLVNGTAASVPIPWDGEWHPVTYDLPAGLNSIVFNPNLDDDDTRHAVHISIAAEQVSGCTDDLVTDISSEDICLGEELTLEATSVNGGTITWDNDVINGEPFTPEEAAIITFTATSDHPDDCDFSVEITIRNLPVIEAGEDIEICGGDEATLIGDGAGADGTYAWTDGVEDGVSFVPAATTTYTVTGTDLHGCENTDDVTVTVHTLPAVNAGADLSVCEGEEVTLTGSGAGAGGTYSWSGGVEDGVSFTPFVSGSFTVNGTDANGCENTDDIMVTLNALPVVDFIGDELSGCDPHTVNFSTSSVGETFEWTFGDGTISNLEDPSHQYMMEGEYDVTLTVASAAGCETTLTYFDYISIVSPPDADFSFVTNDVYKGVHTTQFHNNSERATDYEWDFGDGSPISNVFSPTHLFPGANESGYPVELTAISNLGCRDSIVKKVRMKDVLIYYMPNTFTPDGDNFNETFKPVFVSGFDYYDFHMTIFNRWGEVVFESYNCDYGWNGVYGDKGIVEDGVYIWRIEFGDLYTDRIMEEEGHVTILK